MTTMKIKTVNVIDMNEFDRVVEEVYGRPYNFQQQDGCKSRGTHWFEISGDWETNDFWEDKDSVPEEVNHPDEGVSFKAWLARDPETPLTDSEEDKFRTLWWHRNFYPDFNVVVDDLRKRGIMEEGEYMIELGW